MNIRNLLFTSMIFCTAPVVYAASSFAKAMADRPKVSLTQQEQEQIRQWAKDVKKCPKLKKAMHTVFCIKKDITLLLSKPQMIKILEDFSNSFSFFSTSKKKHKDSMSKKEHKDLEISGMKIARLLESKCNDLNKKLVAYNKIPNFTLAMDSYEQIESYNSSENLSLTAVMKKQLMFELFVLKCLTTQEKRTNDIQTCTTEEEKTNDIQVSTVIDTQEDKKSNTQVNTISTQEDKKADLQAGTTLWKTLSDNPIKTGFGLLSTVAIGYTLYRLYA